MHYAGRKAVCSLSPSKGEEGQGEESHCVPYPAVPSICSLKAALLAAAAAARR
jgi:hypothetical protein